MIIYKDIFNNIVSIDNLFSAWDEFKNGKRSRPDVQRFELYLEENIFALHHELKRGVYEHEEYKQFFIYDPKLRDIYKAIVRDRILHHAIFNILNPLFEPTFIATSFSCRVEKGNHKGVETVTHMLRKESLNNARICYALKCDVRKFFDNIDHHRLISILSKKIKDAKAMNLLAEIVGSYEIKAGFERERVKGAFCKTGIPIGNLTSQLFANIYMNEFDQFIKHVLKVKYYARYTDDFVIVSHSHEYLQSLIYPIKEFLENNLYLSLHPNKISIHKYSQGIDFLGYIILPHCRLIRKRTWKRMLRKFKKKVSEYKNGKIQIEKVRESLNSYLSVLSHADAYELGEFLKNQMLF